nr:hypothetical protein [Pediococcus pentosaceus]
MKIGIIAASGKAGALITKEAVQRGHEVTAIVLIQTELKWMFQFYKKIYLI